MLQRTVQVWNAGKPGLAGARPQAQVERLDGIEEPPIASDYPDKVQYRCRGRVSLERMRNLLDVTRCAGVVTAGLMAVRGPCDCNGMGPRTRREKMSRADAIGRRLSEAEAKFREHEGWQDPERACWRG